MWDPSSRSKDCWSPVSVPLSLKWMGADTPLGSTWEPTSRNQGAETFVLGCFGSGSRFVSLCIVLLCFFCILQVVTQFVYVCVWFFDVFCFYYLCPT